MYTVNEKNINSITIENSKFIGVLFNVQNIDQVKEELQCLKRNYLGANHYSYAYIIDDLEYCTDDGEPGKTAGLPILNVLRKNKLTNVCLVVIRYFGGVKLGTGGLVRAYRSAAETVLESSLVIPYFKKDIYEIVFDYCKEPAVLRIIDKKDIVSKRYNKKVSYTILVSSDIYELVIKEI